ncbi:uncharacterized protein LOC111625059 [Centruroides sculpturatus]|uniref:uncharacterized protein LOC111625059 n=1 Tax=Centruroides sculpturatus TaxID=218467 RepID=UPI000C6D9FF2|nr:uncharacterized protein LOC111625059 [Centruroides sculpturatus]
MGADHHPADTGKLNINYSNRGTDKGDWNIFTDGSKSSIGTGAAFIIYNSNLTYIKHQEYFRLHPYCSINQAELWAMLRALVHVTANQKKYNGSISINTDSKYVLNILNYKGKITFNGARMNHLAQNLNKRRNITFYWVPGHTGIRGNEEADKLAKRAATLNTNYAFSRIPPTYVNKYISERILDNWQEEWESSNTGRTTYKFLPSIHKRQQYNYIIPPTSLHRPSQGMATYQAISTDSRSVTTTTASATMTQLVTYSTFCGTAPPMIEYGSLCTNTVLCMVKTGHLDQTLCVNLKKRLRCSTTSYGNVRFSTLGKATRQHNGRSSSPKCKTPTGLTNHH